MPTDARSTVTKIAIGLDAVLTAAPVQRENIFAGVHRAISLWLESLDAASENTTAADHDDFVRKARIYLRALKTYPAHSDEWLDVFASFRQMFDRWTQVLRPAEPVGVRAGNRPAGEQAQPHQNAGMTSNKRSYSRAVNELVASDPKGSAAEPAPFVRR